MCEFCSLSAQDKQNALAFRANQLIDLANNLNNIGVGFINMHSDDAANVAIKAKNVIRFLVEDWL